MFIDCDIFFFVIVIVYFTESHDIYPTNYDKFLVIVVVVVVVVVYFT